ncbi:MAG: formate dehydrogenase accessory sulfurtransferase FdhD [Saprospiraceae bacterium]|nr:formate dehydrogenase accessory sulfurtransferase FdhD [Saprospiraceae bacterium]
MSRVNRKKILRFNGISIHGVEDNIAGEEPLEIRIRYGRSEQRKTKSIAVTMRTEGDDEDLIRGFLFTENIIDSGEEIQMIKRLDETNRILVELATTKTVDIDSLTRHVFTSSSCGVCGKASLEQVRNVIPHVLKRNHPKVLLEEIITWPILARQKQETFTSTGGLHAAALFSQDGTLLALKEDVGRHNAMDKLIGYALRGRLLPLSETICLLSGRASFELVQKGLMAGIPVLLAVGAPSSLAVELAADNNLTLIGFLRDHQCNIYSGLERIDLPGSGEEGYHLD